MVTAKPNVLMCALRHPSSDPHQGMTEVAHPRL